MQKRFRGWDGTLSEHTLGERLQSVRKRRGLSQRELADASGVSISWIRQIEQGAQADTRVETARKLAVGLRVPTMELIGGSPALPPLASDAVWEPVRQALLRPRDGAAAEPVSEDGLADAVTGAVKLYHDNRYGDLAGMLPGLLRDAQHVPPLLQSRVLQLAGSLLVQTGQRDAARVALDRSLADAEASGSRLDAASSVVTMCWLLLLERQFGRVRTVAAEWADRIEPKLSVASVAEVSTWGWLLLRASAAAIRDNRPDEAAEFMRLAEAGAVAVGRERGGYHSYWTTFGPATVAMKAAENAVIDDKPDVALRLARTVPGNLRPTSDNRNRHLLDVSAAHLALRRHAEAFDVLYRLSREAPVWLVNQRMAGDLLGRIVARRRTLTPQMRELAELFPVP